MKILGFNIGKKKKKTKQIDSFNDLKKYASGQVRIKVYMSFGGGVPTLKDDFVAQEQRDGFGGLVFTNEEREFSEDVDFQKDDIYRQLEIMLKIQDLTKAEKIDKLDKAIKTQKKRLSILDKHVKLNALFNYVDEKVRLSDLEVLREHIANINDRKGAFYTIENGMRVYSFFKKDGNFYPIFNGSDEHSRDPDMVRKSKIYNALDLEFKQEFGERFTSKRATQVLAMFGILTIVAFGICVYLGVVLMGKSQELDLRAQNSALACIDTVNKMQNNIATFYDNELVKKALNNTQVIEIQEAQREVQQLNYTT